MNTQLQYPPSQIQRPQVPITTPQLSILHHQFNLPLRPQQLQTFRGAIAEFAGIEEECFHNHDNATGKFHLGYPLVQYHVERGRACITALGAGVEAMERLLHRYDGRLWMARQWQQAPVCNTVRQDFRPILTAAWHTYHLVDWVPFNNENYEAWRNCEREVTALQMFERTFVGHVLAFACGIGWFVDRRLEAELLWHSPPRWCKRHGQPALAFDATIRIQALLPDNIGLGKGVSIGFGRVEARD